MLELTVRPPDPNRVHSQAVAPSRELGVCVCVLQCGGPTVQDNQGHLTSTHTQYNHLTMTNTQDSSCGFLQLDGLPWLVPAYGTQFRRCL